MNIRNQIILLFLLTVFSCNSNVEKKGMDPVDLKVEALLEKMTLQEKIGQMNQYNGFWDITGPPPEDGTAKDKYQQIKDGKVGSMLNILGAKNTREMQKLAVDNSRLGIPLLFAYDVIHGYKTIMPIPLGESASWDLEAIELSARIAGRESAAAGIHWTFAPMVDVSRDARWGRVMEGSGEDPFLSSAIAVARVKGFQGEDLSSVNTIAACLKHFAAYGFSESGRDYNTVDISEITLRNIVLPPFKAGIDAGAATVMNSFNELNGIPATSNSYLQRDILKGEWDYSGLVVSDWNSIGEIVNHGQAATLKDAARLSVIAGSDMDMEASAYVNHLADLVVSGEVDEKLIDDAVRRILRLKYNLGLFDDPYKYCNEELEKSEILSKENLEASRDIARKSIVLLKNESNILPLSKNKKIAVIGPLADDKDSPIGSWRGQGVTNSAVSLLEGIRKAVDNKSNISYAKGCDLVIGETSFIYELNINQNDPTGISEAVQLAETSDVVILVLGENGFQTGEGRSQADIGLAGVQEELMKAIVKANSNTILVLMNGRPLAIPWAAENIPAIVEAWHLGSEAGNAIADVLFGDYNPSGKLPVSFPRHEGQIPIYYNHKNTGRPSTAPNMVFWSHYTDMENSPLFPFGYGLSYTQFEYSNISVDATTLDKNGSIKLNVDVKNIGETDGDEIVQFYIQDVVSSITRPIKELKGFEKISLKSGETKTVSFTIDKETLQYYGYNGWETESGEFKLFIGGNSVDLLETSIVFK